MKLKLTVVNQYAAQEQVPFTGCESAEKQSRKVNGTAHRLIIFCRFLASVLEHSTLISDEPHNKHQHADNHGQGKAEQANESGMMFLRMMGKA